MQTAADGIKSVSTAASILLYTSSIGLPEMPNSSSSRSVTPYFRVRSSAGSPGIDEVDNDVGKNSLLERGLKRFDQMRRQTVDETDGISQQHLAAARKRKPAA